MKPYYMILIVLAFVSIGLLHADEQVFFENVDPVTFAKIIKEHKNDPQYLLLDVRTPDEFNAGHIEGAVNIDYYAANFKTLLDGLDRTKVYLLYCRSGHRSGNVMKIMKSMGFTRLYNLNGGYNEWTRQRAE